MPPDMTDNQQSPGPDVQQALGQGMPGAPMNIGAIPPTNPVQASVNPQAGPMPTQMGQPQQGGGDFASTVSSVMGLPQFSGPMQRLQQLQENESDLQRQYTSLQQPNWGPHIQKGASFLHNLGQVMLMAASMTKPGAAIESSVYGPGIKQYEAKRTNLADQLSTMKAQEQPLQEQLGATTGAAQAAGLAAYRGRMANVAEERADTQKEAVKARIQNNLATLDFKHMQLNQTTQNQLTQHLDRMMAQEEQNYRANNRNATDVEIAKYMGGVRQDTANLAAAQNPSFMGVLKQWAGIEPVQTPGGATPERRPIGATPKQAQTKQRPAGVPPDYVYNAKGPRGPGWYKPNAK